MYQFPPPAMQPADESSIQQPRISSKYRGLCWDKKHRAWRVRIFYMGKQRHVGRFRDDIAAARAYDKAAVYLYGDKAILNFSMEECLADPSEVSGFIILALEQAKESGKATPQQANDRGDDALQLSGSFLPVTSTPPASQAALYQLVTAAAQREGSPSLSQCNLLPPWHVQARQQQQQPHGSPTALQQQQQQQVPLDVEGNSKWLLSQLQQHQQQQQQQQHQQQQSTFSAASSAQVQQQQQQHRLYAANIMQCPPAGLQALQQPAVPSSHGIFAPTSVFASARDSIHCSSPGLTGQLLSTSSATPSNLAQHHLLSTGCGSPTGSSCSGSNMPLQLLATLDGKQVLLPAAQPTPGSMLISNSSCSAAYPACYVAEASPQVMLVQQQQQQQLLPSAAVLTSACMPDVSTTGAAHSPATVAHIPAYAILQQQQPQPQQQQQQVVHVSSSSGMVSAPVTLLQVQGMPAAAAAHQQQYWQSAEAPSAALLMELLQNCNITQQQYQQWV